MFYDPARHTGGGMGRPKQQNPPPTKNKFLFACIYIYINLQAIHFSEHLYSSDWTTEVAKSARVISVLR